MIADKPKGLRLPARHFCADALFLAGIGIIAFGISMFSPPAAIVFAGAAVIYIAIIIGRD